MSEIETQVVIPLRNGASHISELLESLVAQSKKDFLVVVSDNGSTDNSIDIVKRFGNILNLHIIDSSEKVNKAFALNEAIKTTNLRKILFLDQDDTVNELYVSAMSEALDGSCLTAACMDSERLNGKYEVKPRVAPLDQKIGQFAIRVASGGSMGVTRDAILGIGLFNEEFNYSTNDVEFCCRAHYKGYQMQLVEGAILNYRFRDTLIANFKQGVYYGKGNFKIAKIYPEVRGDQIGLFDLSVATSKLLLSFLKNRKSRARSIHSIGKNFGQIGASLGGRL